MTMTNKPIVMKAKPKLYAKHTKHFSKAEKMTYNYVYIDDYIVENYKTKTLKQMTYDLNEYFHRIVYRYQWLQKNNIIVTPSRKQRLELAAKEAERKLVEAYRDHVIAMARLEEIKSSLV
jgi:hypothetical protein